jgi:zinc transporter, ZIP family
MDPNKQLLFAFLLTTLAGLSTGIGGLVAFIKYARKERFLAFSLGLSAGAMIYISFVELIVGSLDDLKESNDADVAYMHFALLFLGGLLASGLISKVIGSMMEDVGIFQSKPENQGLGTEEVKKKKKLYRTGVVTAVALAIHNLPEGLITFLTSMQDIQLGIGIAAAIAIHNIPEGLAVAIPIYRATHSKTTAFFITMLSGLSEPFGAAIAYFVFFRQVDQDYLVFVTILVSSVMVYVAFFELIPAAMDMGYKRLTSWGIITGMSIMGISLVLLG